MRGPRRQVTLTSMKSIFKAKNEEKKAVETGAQRDLSTVRCRGSVFDGVPERPFDGCLEIDGYFSRIGISV